MNLDLPIDLLHVVVDPQFVAFGIRSNGAIGVATHGDLMWLHEANLTILVEDAERVSLGFENHTNSLQTEGEY